MEIIKLKYFNVQSRIVLKEKVTFKNITFEPDSNSPINTNGASPIGSIEVTLNLNEKNNRLHEQLVKKKSSDGRFCLHYIAMSELNNLFYKFALIFSVPIYFDYPIYLKFDDKENLFLIKNASDGYLTPLNSKSFDLKEKYVYKESGIIGGDTNYIKNDSLKLLNRVTTKFIHLGYLYYSAVNYQFDKYFRLLSAWKYLEEYIELKGKVNIPQHNIPECIFREIFRVRNLKKITIVGINQTSGKCWFNYQIYNEQFLKDFYNEVRNLIAHHKRDKKLQYGISEKKHTPFMNVQNDLKMDKALNAIIVFLNILNEDTFVVTSDYDQYDIEHRTRKYIRFPKRL